MKNPKLAWLGMVVLLIATVALTVVYSGYWDRALLEEKIGAAGPVAPLIFMLVYIVATVLFLPGVVLSLAGGALFGPALGTFYSLTGATVGAALAFLIARYLASDWVVRKAGSHARHVIEGAEAEGWRFVAFVRLVPLFPFNLLNYALGLTRIKFTPYVVTTYIAMFPGALAYTYLGYAGRESLTGGEDLVQKVLLALGLLAMTLFLPGLVKRWRQPVIPMLTIDQLKSRLDVGEPTFVLDVRTPKEFHGETGHIAGARNIPVEELERRLKELETVETEPLVVICRTDRRARKAAQVLNRAGFSKVSVVREGMLAWQRAGLPVEK